MKITQIGANRNRSPKEIFGPRDTPVSWSSLDKTIKLEIPNTGIPGLDGEYNVYVNLELSDIAKIIHVLAEAGMARNLDDICDALKHSARDLNHLQSAALK
jgi:hypothetical protein